MSENYNQNKKHSQKVILILLFGILGVALLFMGGAFDKGEKEDVAETVAEHGDADAYAAMLEERVAEICSSVSGAGKVSVFVSLKGGYRTVYAIDAQSNSSGYKSEVVMSGSGSDKKAVVTAYQNPEIAGVGIVCEATASDEVKSRIISLVSAALDIPTNKIYVA